MILGTAVLLAASAATRYEADSTVDATIRNCAPSSVGCGYVIGHAHPGDTVDITYKPSNNDASWSYGHVYGSFDRCGWIQNGNISPKAGNAQSLCSSQGTNLSYTTFMSEINALPGSGVADGSFARIDYSHTNCDPVEAGRAWGNVDPFETAPTAGADYYGTLADNTAVMFRYTTRNGMWAMVRNVAGTLGGTTDNWFFVRRNCLTPNNAPIPVP